MFITLEVRSNDHQDLTLSITDLSLGGYFYVRSVD